MMMMKLVARSWNMTQLSLFLYLLIVFYYLSETLLFVVSRK